MKAAPGLHPVSDAPIAAIATAAGPAGVSMVRVSGAGALELGDRLVPGAHHKPSQRESGTFFHARIVHPLTHEPVDDAVLLVYRAPHSYTGEETLEIQGHGGALPSRSLLAAVLAAGARIAEAGEFTKRAFLNGRLDLTQAEAVCDFIQAKTERSALVARAQLDGVLGHRIGRLYDQMMALCAEVEHLLDFDEGELPDTFAATTGRMLMERVAEIEGLVASWNEGQLLRDGALVVICGRPNAGKSSLLNALLGRNRAIVHAVPGTTRDVIEESYALNGVPLRLVDTAGLRITDNEVEREGIERAQALMRQADLTLFLVDQSEPWASDETPSLTALPPSRAIIVLTKCDLPSGGALPAWSDVTQVRLSTVSGEGLDALRTAICEKLGLEHESSGSTVVTLRHVTELRQAARHAREAAVTLSEGSDRLVMSANHLREASEALGRIVGRIYSDDLLDTIFGRFCVGK